MDPYQELIKNLDEIIALEPTTPPVTLAGYIVGELLGDYDEKYTGLYDADPIVQNIGELASDLEIENGNTGQLVAMWQELKDAVEQLKHDHPSNK